MDLPYFTVGVTGHRPNRLHIGEARVARRLALILVALRAGARGRRKIAVTALAEGSDRLFAAAARASGFMVHALLPFASADYETTFGDKATTPLYRELLSLADEREELTGSLGDPIAAYEAVGRLTVARSDVLVAVWDGKPAAGRGGTPEIIAYALACRKPVIWIGAAREGRPRILRLPTGFAWPAPALDVVARRSRPATTACISALACTPEVLR